MPPLVLEHEPDEPELPDGAAPDAAGAELGAGAAELGAAAAELGAAAAELGAAEGMGAADDAGADPPPEMLTVPEAAPLEGALELPAAIDEVAVGAEDADPEAPVAPAVAGPVTSPLVAGAL